MIFTLQQYQLAKPISLPHKTNHGIIIEQITGFCVKCNNPVEKIKGHIIEHQTCTEFKMAGACHHCKMLTSFQMRYYSDGRVMAYIKDEWQDISPQPKWYNRFKKKIQRLLF